MADVHGTFSGVWEPTWMQSLTLEVKLSRPLRLRMWLALQAFRLAAWLMGTGFDLEIDDYHV